MTAGGVFIRFGGVGIRILQLLCSIVALGIFSYFLAVLAHHNLHIETHWKAVEGLSGAAVLYTIFGVILTVCLGGVTFFAFLAIVLDVLFVGAFVVVAWYTRHGANSCTGTVATPLGAGNANMLVDGQYHPYLHTACRLDTAVFAVSLINIFLFVLSAFWQVLMVRHHKKEKRYGPSPANNYTSGSGRTPFWKRKRAAKNTRDAEMATAGGARVSNDTTTTIGNNAYQPEAKYGEPGHNAAYGNQGYRTTNGAF